MDNEKFFAPWRVVAAFGDGSRLTFDGFTEEQAKDAMEAAQEEHGDIWWWCTVTDENYVDGKYYKLIPPPPTVDIDIVDFAGYPGPFDENGFPVGLLDQIRRDHEERGIPPEEPLVIIKRNEPKDDPPPHEK